jgi:nucleotide-binding universal stress UspA family protein
MNLCKNEIRLCICGIQTTTEPEEMETCCPQVKRILMPTDLSEKARGALRYAAAMAAQTGAELHIIHVLTVHGYDPVLAKRVLNGLRDALQSMEAQLVAQMKKEAAAAVEKGVSVKTAVVRSMAPYDAILDYTRQNDIDQIIMGTHGRTGLSYVLLGSVAEKVVEYAPCPVLVVSSGERNFVDAEGMMLLDRIMFPTDFSEPSRWAAPRAKEMARASKAEIIVAHVIGQNEVVHAGMSEAGADTAVAAKIEQTAREKTQKEADHIFGDYAKVQVQVRSGPVPQTLAELARDELIDLVVIASKGKDSFKEQLLGSVAERMLRLAPCPVLVIKHPRA